MALDATIAEYVIWPDKLERVYTVGRFIRVAGHEGDALFSVQERTGRFPAEVGTFILIGNTGSEDPVNEAVKQGGHSAPPVRMYEDQYTGIGEKSGITAYSVVKTELSLVLFETERRIELILIQVYEVHRMMILLERLLN